MVRDIVYGDMWKGSGGVKRQKRKRNSSRRRRRMFEFLRQSIVIKFWLVKLIFLAFYPYIQVIF